MADRLVTLYIATPFSWFTLASMPPPPSLFLSLTLSLSLSFSHRFFHFTLYSATLIFSPHKQPLKNPSAQQQTKNPWRGGKYNSSLCVLVLSVHGSQELPDRCSGGVCLCVLTACVTGLWRKQAAWPSSRLRQAEKHRSPNGSDLFSTTVWCSDTERRADEGARERTDGPFHFLVLLVLFLWALRQRRLFSHSVFPVSHIKCLTCG